MIWLRWILAGLALLAAAALTSPPHQFVPVLGGQALARVNVWTGNINLCVPEGSDRSYVCYPDAWDALTVPAAD